MNYNITKHIDKLLKEEFEFLPRNIDNREEERIKKIQNTKIWKGDLDLRENEYITNLGDLEVVEGDLNLNNCKNLTSLGNLKEVKGYLDLENCKNLTSLGNLKEVRGGLHLSHCQNLTSLGNLKVVEENLALSYSDINYIPEDIIIKGCISKNAQYNKEWTGPNKIKEFNEFHREKGLLKEEFDFVPRNIDKRHEEEIENEKKRLDITIDKIIQSKSESEQQKLAIQNNFQVYFNKENFYRYVEDKKLIDLLMAYPELIDMFKPVMGFVQQKFTKKMLLQLIKNDYTSSNFVKYLKNKYHLIKNKLDYYAFIGGDKFVETTKGNFQKKLEIENLFKVNNNDFTDFTDRGKFQLAGVMKIRAKSNNKDLYSITCSEGLLDEYEGMSDEQMPEYIVSSIDERKKRS